MIKLINDIIKMEDPFKAAIYNMLLSILIVSLLMIYSILKPIEIERQYYFMISWPIIILWNIIYHKKLSEIHKV